jgi:hypothetical protein
VGVAVLAGVLVPVGLRVRPRPHPFTAASSALRMHSTLTRPLPSQSKREQWSSDTEPRAISSPVTTSSMVTVPLLSQSPKHGRTARAIVASARAPPAGAVRSPYHRVALAM